MTDTSESASTLKVVSSFMVAMILRIIPLPKDLALLNPDWVAIVLLYWILAVPERCGVLRAWTIGLVVDALTGRLLGQHALAYGVMVYRSSGQGEPWRPPSTGTGSLDSCHSSDRAVADPLDRAATVAGRYGCRLLVLEPDRCPDVAGRVLHPCHA